RPRFLREVGWFALRTGIVFGVVGLVLLGCTRILWPEIDFHTQRTMLLSFLILLGLTALFRALRDAEPEPLLGDNRFRLVGIVAIPFYLLAMYVPFSAHFFELEPLGVAEWLLVVIMVAAGYGLSLWTDRWRA